MRKEEVMKAVEETKVVAIVRGLEPEVCVKLATAYRESGIRVVEVTFDPVGDSEKTVAAIKAIRAAFPDLYVGAGTVLTEAQLNLAISAGAEFMVSPTTNPGLVRQARAAGLVALPGALTPTEVAAAHEAGADYVAVFPVRALGAAHIKDLLSQLRHIKLLAVGGVTDKNAADYIKAGCVGVCVGGPLANVHWILTGEYGKIANAAAQLVANCR
jgi:2-dehydro-3-deoxyphosphogluconate aldolase / (4S)-4-hydroxy-2-oxoglutarate aldolase